MRGSHHYNAQRDLQVYTMAQTDIDSKLEDPRSVPGWCDLKKKADSIGLFCNCRLVSPNDESSIPNGAGFMFHRKGSGLVSARIA